MVSILMALIILPNILFSQHQKHNKSTETAPLNIIVDQVVLLYQKNIIINSISRCPFKVSCSNYLLESVRRDGFIKGIVTFVDRYYYRENPFIYKKYKLVIQEKYLLDDKISKNYINYLYTN